MPGRNAKPVDMLLQERRKHLTEAEIAARREAEASMAIGTDEIVCPAYVRDDLVACAKWDETIKNYGSVSFFTSADVGHLARYCKLYSEWRDLIDHRKRIQNIEFDSDEEDKIFQEMEDHLGKRQAKKMWQKVEYIMSLAGLLGIDKAINSKAMVLTSMEDRLYLNSLARVKNVPVVKKPKADPLDEAGFGTV
jgi:phage terminase small subunit